MNEGGNMIVRKAELSDLQALLDIYNYEVENGISTLDLHKKTYDEQKVWFDAHNKDNHPLITAEEDGSILGYASLSPYRDKEAYETTVELSVYVSPKFRKMGVATALMKEIINLAYLDEKTHTVVSVITSGNDASAALHKKFGFTFCGTVKRVGKKFGRFLDIDNYYLFTDGEKQ